MSLSSSLVTPEDVLETLMNDGTIDAIRLKIINQLKANEELKNNTITMVEQSKVLNTPGAEKQTKRELFDALRRELETPVLEKASKSVWELIIGSDGVGKEISEIVGKTFFRLSGQELPQGPPQLPILKEDTQIQKETDGNEKDVEKENETKKETVASSSKKRTFDEIKEQEEESGANITSVTFEDDPLI
ncbi:hypothetical protein ZOSMA_283G00230 [Zostera marina]|uniref:Antigenic heat-stable protein n=1 Tax=Zostera marina TaxID=29655 RepID=A0A0K9PF89_ZOSMR|nr:hypothetical protein ZOSMA_283G00230 [Zostera marina]